MIELGLSRITRLLANSTYSWRAIHVAGTNGKGSVCAYVSALLHANHVPCGRFTSPHLIDRWDCITVNEKTVKEETFREVEAVVKKRNSSENIQASEFELLTATAFEIFSWEKVKIAAIEVGMGGRLDATNALQDPLVTVITNISMDHQAFLGTTIKEIARHKSGIMKSGVPTVVDSSNPQAVLDVIMEESKTVQAGPTYSLHGTDYSRVLQETPWGPSILETQPHQATNIGLAVKAIETALQDSHLFYDRALTWPTLAKVAWPGRQQRLSIEPLTGRKEDILLDGAHNDSSIHALDTYMSKTFREGVESVTWVLAMSHGKDVAPSWARAFQDIDSIVLTEFGPVDGMPWVAATPASELQAAVNSARHMERSETRPKMFVEKDLSRALEKATELSGGAPLVVCGSLYLVSDVLRLLRDKSAADQND